jgi:hypothetical protein
MKIILYVFYMHAFTSLTFLTYSIHCFHKKIEFMCNKVYIMRVVNMNFLVHKIVVQCMENNSEHYVSWNSLGSYNVSKYSNWFRFSRSMKNLLLVLFLLKELYNKKMGAIEQLVKAIFPRKLQTICPVLRPYVRFEVFKENLSLSTRPPSLQNQILRLLMTP